MKASEIGITCNLLDVEYDLQNKVETFASTLDHPFILARDVDTKREMQALGLRTLSFT